MRSFDYVSDLHVDFWTSNFSNDKKFNKSLELYFKDILPAPEDRSNLLIVSGDISNLNSVSKKTLEYLSKCYKKVLIVWGNHDLYLESKSQMSRYDNNSFKRIKELEEYIKKELFNVEVLKGQIVEYEGIKYGGTGMWYDFSYGIDVLGYTYNQIYDIYSDKINYFNDSILIKGFIKKDYFESEYAKLYKIINEVDVIITHIPPSYKLIEDDMDYLEEKIHISFYTFDGSSLLNGLKHKIWLYGHVHGFSSYTDINDNKFIRNCIGYRSDELNYERKIRKYNL